MHLYDFLQIIYWTLSVRNLSAIGGECQRYPPSVSSAHLSDRRQVLWQTVFSALHTMYIYAILCKLCYFLMVEIKVVCLVHLALKTIYRTVHIRLNHYFLKTYNTWCFSNLLHGRIQDLTLFFRPNVPSKTGLEN